MRSPQFQVRTPTVGNTQYIGPVTKVWRALSVIVPLVAILGLTSSQSGAQSSAKASPLKPRGTLSEKLALLTTPELASVPGAPTGIKAVPRSHSVSLFKASGEQKGPCGTAIKLPSKPKTFPTGAGTEFQAESLKGFQYVVDLPGNTATDLLDGWKKQNHPGCPAYRSTTPYGTVQTTKLIAALPMPAFVDQGAGSLEQVSSAGSSLGIYAFIFRSGQRIELISLFVTAPVTQTFGEGLARLAESRLNASQGSAA
jgi:hypothetical protein